MNKTIIIKDGSIEILQDGYNLIERTVYDDKLVKQAHELLDAITDDTIPF